MVDKPAPIRKKPTTALPVRPVIVRATLVGIYEDGKAGTPYVARLQLPDGKIRTLVSEKPVAAKVGDDLSLIAYEPTDGQALSLPKGLSLLGNVPTRPLFVPAEATDLAARIEKLLGRKVAVRSFGPSVGLEEKPSLVAWGKLALVKIGIAIPSPKVTVIAAAETSRDPIVQWAVSMFKPALKSLNPIVLVDPNAVISAPFGRLSRTATLKQGLPARLSALVDAGNLGKNVLAGDVLLREQGLPGMPTVFPGTLIVPYSPLETATSEFSRLTGLPANGFALKQNVDPMVRRHFSAAHALAMTVLDQFGFARNKAMRHKLEFRAPSKFDVNHRNECFADAFATLAVARLMAKGGQYEGQDLGRLADWHDATGVVGNGDRMTGRAMRAAIEAYNAGPKDEAAAGQALVLSDLAVAADLAMKHAYAPRDLMAVQLNLLSHSNKPVTSLFAISAAKASEGGLFDVAHAALGRVSTVPGDLANKSARRQAADTYAADLDATLAAGTGDKAMLEAVIDSEAGRHARQGITVHTVAASTAAVVHTEIHDTLAGDRWRALQKAQDAFVAGPKAAPRIVGTTLRR